MSTPVKFVNASEIIHSSPHVEVEVCPEKKSITEFVHVSETDQHIQAHGTLLMPMKFVNTSEISQCTQAHMLKLKFALEEIERKFTS